jgi:hypothetical protein
LFGAVSVLPIVVWTAFLQLWLGSTGQGALFSWLPFDGLITSPDWQAKRQGVVILTVVVPALLASAAALTVLRKTVAPRVEVAFLLLNVLLFVVFLGPVPYAGGYTAVGRLSIGVVLAGVLSAPLLQGAGPRARRLALTAGVLWTLMLPVIAAYGFGG